MMKSDITSKTKKQELKSAVSSEVEFRWRYSRRLPCRVYIDIYISMK